jgi:glycosyltransferase involved in cell wall biosynthesis
MKNQKINEPLPKIGLSIIVKNEAKVIERMLNTVWPILDYYCVVDTGSTDGTQEIVRRFFEEKGIPGEVVDHEWVNFQDARNRAMELVKDKCDFAFWIDADEQLMIDKAFNLEAFKRNISKFDGGNVLIHYGGQNYYRMQFYKTSVDWYWYGPVHEVLVCDSPTNVGVAQGLGTLVTPDGNSWTTETIQQKYEGHAKILEEYVANDPKKDPRWVFYLAQSYRDAQSKENQEKAIEWYQKRVGMVGGYWEEVYFSALMVANLKSQLGYPEHEVIEEFLKCGKYNPKRIEHLLPVMVYYHAKKEYDIAYILGLRAIQCDGKLPTPHSSLFIDHATYLWKLWDLHSISSWYSGRKEEAIRAFKRLLKAVEKGYVPENQLERIRENKKFFIGK